MMPEIFQYEFMRNAFLAAFLASIACGVIGAFVVVKKKNAATDDLAKELQDYVKAAVAPYKYPRIVRFVDQLPRNESGKIQRFRLRE